MYPVSGDLFLTSPDALDDSVILHEYGHWLQYSIGSFAWIVSDHGGCTPQTLSIPSGATPEDIPKPQPYRYEQQAWLEGFADWFAFTIVQTLGQAPGVNFDGTTTGWSGAGESTFCSESIPGSPGFRPGDQLERHVANMLIDLSDPYPAPPGTTAPPDDDNAQYLETLIIQIMDYELGTPQTRVWPVADQFYVWMLIHRFNGVTQSTNDLNSLWTLNQLTVG